MSSSSSSVSSMEIAAIPEFKQPHRMTQSQSSHQQQRRRKNLALSCTVLCAVGAAASLLPDGWGGPLASLRGTGRTLKVSKQRRLQLAAADYSALLAGAAPAAAAAPAAMGAAPSMPAAGGSAELSDADVAKFLAKYDLELKDLELLQKLREGYVRADGSASTAGASAASASTAPDYSSMMAAGGAPPVPPSEPPAAPAAPATDYAALLAAPAASSAPEVAAATPAAATSSVSKLAVPLGPVEDCSGEGDNWLQNFCELRNYKNTYGDCNVSQFWFPTLLL